MKKILAIAIATAFAAPAFAATSNVDVYGVLNVSIDRVDPDQAGKDSSTSVNFQRQPPRLQGFRRSGWRPESHLADRIRLQC